MKKWKSYVKMLGFLTVGAVLGASTNMAVHGLGKENLRSFTKGIQNWLQDQYLPLGICLIILILAVNVGGLLYVRSLFKKEEELEDEDILDQLEEKAQLCHGLMITGSTVLVILAIMLMGIGITETLEGLYSTGICFVVVLAAVIFQTVAIHQMQKHDSRLKGDPNGLHFQRDWMNSCDEAEKMKIYEATYKSCLLVCNLFPVAMILALLIKFIWNTGSGTIFLIGLLWMIQVVSVRIYSRGKSVTGSL